VTTHRKVKLELKTIIDDITEKRWQSRIASSCTARTNKTFETIRSYKKFHYNNSRMSGISLQTHLGVVANRLSSEALLPSQDRAVLDPNRFKSVIP
jgi:hypothetical protein